jgi:Arc/MetJ family transcription regulator
MSKTLIDIDPDLLEQAQRILGVGTKKAAVNGALREVVRREAVVRFLERARDGVFAGPGAERRQDSERTVES